MSFGGSLRFAVAESAFVSVSSSFLVGRCPYQRR
jgi:hypothetical protein